MKVWVEKARRPEVVGGIGGFAGLFDASALARYGTRCSRPRRRRRHQGRHRQALDKHDTIGFDLVGMVVDDLVVCGAEPLFLTDYIACGKVVRSGSPRSSRGSPRAASRRLRAARRRDRGAPRAARADEYDVAGATIGVVEADALLGPDRVRPGDVLVAMASSGLHSNGYSLVRKLFLERGRLAARPAGRRTRPRPSARSCSSRPGSTPSPVWRWPAETSDTCDGAHHRWRPGRQPGAGACRPSSSPGRPRHLEPRPIFGLVGASAACRAGRPRESTLNWGSAWSRSCPRTTLTRRS